MKQIKILTYILDFALSNKYLKVIIHCLEPMISNEKGDILFGFFIKNKTSTFSFNKLNSKNCMLPLNIYLIDASPDYK